jgi:ATP-dependent RNA helicase RhlE
MKNFSELSLSPVLVSNLTRNGFVTMTPVQTEAIPPALDGRDLIATAQTGTGKTLAFVLPLLETLLKHKTAKGIQADARGIRAVVLSPTRELAMQIHAVFGTLAQGSGISAAVVVGGMNEDRQLTNIKKGAAVLIATPGRLADFMERRLVRLAGVRVLVLDEADRMLDMGFLPTIKRILSELPATRQTLFFSATIENSVAHLMHQHLQDPVRVAVGEITRPVESIDLHLYETEQTDKVSLLGSLLDREKGTFLVFTRTKHGADRLAKQLDRRGVNATRIHGNRSQGQRNAALKGFQEGQFRVLVATDVAARGIHVEGIAHVVNFDLPMVPEDFIHRVGRTGRAGKGGTASTFATVAERGEIKRIERTLNIKLKRAVQSPKRAIA